VNGEARRGLKCLLVFLALCAGCRRSSVASNGAPERPSGEPTSPTPAPAQVAASPAKTGEEVPLLLGPGPAGVSATERERRLQELLSGQIRSERLPLVDTAPDVPYDPGLHARLTTISIERPVSRAEVSFGLPKRLSGTLDETQTNRIVAGMRPGIRQCYRRFLEEHTDASPSHRFEIELLINADGSVGSVKFEGKRIPKLPEFFACAKARALASLFDPATSEPSRVRFSVELSNPAPAPASVK